MAAKPTAIDQATKPKINMFSKLKRFCWKRFLSDKKHIELQYKSVYGHFPDLVHPRTFDEKLQWYKLYYRNPLMTKLADKHRVREYVIQKGLGHILNEQYGVYARVDQIALESLPAAFVLKANHGSGMNLICKNKQDLDWNASRRLLRRWLKKNYYRKGREWAYKDIPPRIVCEKYLENEEFGELIDYKFFCYGGKPEAVFVCSGRFSADGVRYDCYDLSWRRIPVYKGRPASGLHLDQPSRFAEMAAIATKLADEFPFIRVDLYLVRDAIVFGELTFYPDNGTGPFSPAEYNRFFGDFFVLPDRMTGTSG